MNLTNYAMGHIKSLAPEVGMGATILMYSDRIACTIISIKNNRCVLIQEDHHERTDNNGMSESQTYKFSPDPNGIVHKVTLRRGGYWAISKSTTRVVLGERDHYYDFSF